MKNVYLVAIVFVLSSCASYTNGKKASAIGEKKQDVTVKAFINKEFTTDYFTFVQVDFVNNTKDWKDIKKVTLNSSDKDIKIIVGPRLRDWNNAIRQKVAIDRYNREVLFGAAMGVAAVAAIDSSYKGNVENSKAFLAAMAGTAVASDINNLTNNISDLERAVIFPTTHLMAPFSIPPGLFAKRWILLQIKSDVQLVTFSFNVHYKDGSKNTYNVDFMATSYE
jgi:hypothetical protein